MVNEIEVEDPNAEPGKEYVYTIEHEINVVNLSQSGCGLNTIEERKTAREWDPRCNLSQRSKRKTASAIRKRDRSGLKICGQTKRYDFHVGGRDETYPECKLFV